VAIKRGLILTSDLFYPGPLDDELAFYSKANALAVEMECSTLFIIGQLRGIQTAATLVLDGNPLKWHEGVYDPDPKRLQASVEACARAALSTLASL
jgi:uridine phosphorylase